MKRKDQREWLVKMTYEALVRREKSQDIEALLAAHELPVGNPYLIDSMTSLFHHWDELEKLVQKHLNNWKLERLPLIDRAILMVAANEMAYTKLAPPSVTINECVEIAKSYSDASSFRFVNGVLASVFQDLQTAKEGSDQPGESSSAPADLKDDFSDEETIRR